MKIKYTGLPLLMVLTGSVYADMQALASTPESTEKNAAISNVQEKTAQIAEVNLPDAKLDVAAAKSDNTTETLKISVAPITLVVSPFISQSLSTEIQQQYKKHLLSTAFKDYLTVNKLSVYNNMSTNKFAVAEDLATAKTLSQNNVYYALKDSDMKQTIVTWAKQSQLSINTDDLADAKITHNVIYIGSLTDNNSTHNPLYQLISDTLGWEKKNA